jgi:DNA (cytosine-5)-methyltransferase 1
MPNAVRYLSVCSGMEAASVAWHHLGWTPVGFSEIEPFPCAILKHRFPNTPNYGSLTEYTSWQIEPGSINLLVGGTPCQSFSVAGLRKGLTDPRGNLALTFLGLADKLKPRWIVWENVPGVLSSGGGRDFGSFLGALVELGYGFAYRVLDAQHFGVPQRRRRVFVVACLGDWRAAAEVLSLGEGLRGYLETGNKKRKGPAADAGASPAAGGLQRTVGTLCADTHPRAYSGQDAYTGRLIPAPITQADVAGPLDAHYYKGPGSRQGGEREYVAHPIQQQKPVSHWDGGDVHPTLNQSAKGSGGVGSSNQELFSQGGAYLVPGQPIPIQDGREIEKHQNGIGVGNPGDPAYTIDTTGAQAAGIPFRKSKRACSTTDNETWVPADASNTLNNFDLGDTRTTHAVVQPKVYENHPNDSRVTGPIDVAPTVVSRFGTGGGNVPLVNNEPQVACFKSGQGAQSRSIGWSEIVSPTLPSNAGGNTAPAVIGLNPPMAVRRLTPVECERLQGFPDNWSRISWKGKPEEDCPDGPRYKACGNSMAVPVMRWIGERIAAVDATLPSHA